jgi:hypothetical protein
MTLTIERNVLEVTAQPSNRVPGQVVAFIGKQLCFFENDSKRMPDVDETVPVMVTRALYKRDQVSGGYDFDRLIALLLREVSDQYTLVQHRGFECAGSMCTTTAVADVEGKTVILTPGRTSVKYADNVNVGWNGHTRQPLSPGFAYVKTDDLQARLRGKPGVLRIEGLARLEDAEYFHAIRM